MDIEGPLQCPLRHASLVVLPASSSIWLLQEERHHEPLVLEFVLFRYVYSDAPDTPETCFCSHCTWARPDYALGRQLYALRRCWGTNMIVYTDTGVTALEGRLLRS